MTGGESTIDELAEAFEADPVACAVADAFLAETRRHRRRRAAVAGPAPRRDTGPTRWAVIAYWRSAAGRARLPTCTADARDGEPCCMACGRRGREVVEARTVAERWNRSGLQRAHLFAHACGGPFTVENVVLLCDLCHAESDAISSTLGPDAMLRWVARHEPWGEVVARHMTWAVPPELAGVAAFALGIYFQGGVDEVP